MKKNAKRSGFTTVELVIVIAVIAILATVLIPTFSGLIAKANDSKVLQEAKNAYTTYLIEKNGSAPEVMLYNDGERWIPLRKGVPGDVYATQEDALKAVVDNPDLTKVVDTGDGKLFTYGGEPGNGGHVKESLTGKKISFMGDSISTFEGWSNNGEHNSTIADNRVMYNKKGDSKYQNLLTVDETWWKKTVDELGLELCVNNSYSGSRVTSGGQFPAEVGCGDRAINLHNDNTGEMPDIIVIFMGTNDYQQIGSSVSVDAFARDYAVMVEKIKNKYPNADVYLCTLHHYDNVKAGMPFASSVYNEKIKSIAATYNCNIVDFYNGTGVTPANLESYTLDLLIDRNDISLVHPNASGMAKMYECVKEALAKNYKIEEAAKESYSVTFDADQLVTVGAHPSVVTEGDAFEVTLAGNALTVTVTMGGNRIDAYNSSNGKIIIPYVTGDIVITATSGYDWMKYWNELPAEFDSTTNLYSKDLVTGNGYYNSSKVWAERTDLITAVIPVSEGMQIKSSSFVHVSGSNKGTYISWIKEDGTLQGVTAAEVYEQQTTVGYVEVPEGVIAVSMVWRTNCQEEGCKNNYMNITIPNQN